ncbi:MAG: hypothetical protein ACLU9S_05050 [Oscillospiraceae bacterium]
MLARIKETGGDTPYISYFTKNKRDEPLKSTTIAITASADSYRPDVYEFYLNTPWPM